MFKKGDYIVLLSDCTGGSSERLWEGCCPGYVYRLREDMTWNNFQPEIDRDGNKSNGWSVQDTPEYRDRLMGKVTARAATEAEIQGYIQNWNKPVPAEIPVTSKFLPGERAAFRSGNGRIPKKAFLDHNYGVPSYSRNDVLIIAITKDPRTGRNVCHCKYPTTSNHDCTTWFFEDALVKLAHGAPQPLKPIDNYEIF